MKIEMKEDDIRKMITFAKGKIPEEACGLIAGTESAGSGELKKYIF